MNDTDDTTGPEYTKQRWVYLGVYEGQTSKRVASFRTEDGTTRSYSVGPWNKALAVGYIYVVQAADGSIKATTPEWTGDRADDTEDLRLAARERDFVWERQALEKRARTGNSPELDQLLTHVEEYAAKIISTSGKAALVTLLSKAVWQARRSR